MILRLLILNVWFFNPSSTVFCAPQNPPNEHLKYFIDVFNHIRIQPGWGSGDTYTIMSGDNSYILSLDEFLSEKVDQHNFYENIPIINNLINFKFTEVLKLFNILLTRFVTKCYNYPLRSKAFVRCSQDLRRTVGKSSDVFVKLSDATAFLSYINSKIYKIYGLNMNSIDEQLQVVRQHTLSKSGAVRYNRSFYSAGKVVGKIEQFCTFITELTDTLDDFNEKWCCCTENSIPAILLAHYSVDVSESVTATDYEHDMNNLDTFYRLTIKTEFEELGFVQLIDSTDDDYICPPYYLNEQGVSEYQPPINNNVSQYTITDSSYAEDDVEEGEFIPDSIEDYIDMRTIDLNK